MYDRSADLYRRLHFSGLAAPILVGVLTLVSLYGMLQVSESQKVVRQSNTVLSTARVTESDLKNLEASLRLYVTAHRDADLRRYIQAEKDFNLHLSELRDLVQDNPAQVRRLDEIRARTDRWLTQSNEQLLMPRQTPSQDKDSLYWSGDRLVRENARSLDEFMNSEAALTAEKVDDASSLQKFLILVAVLLAAVTFLVMIYLHRRSLHLFEKSARSQSELSIALQAGRMATWSIDPATRMIHMTPEYKRLLGDPHLPDEVSFDRNFTFTQVEYRNDLRAAIEASLRTGVPLSTDFRVTRADGTPLWLHFEARMMQFKKGDRRLLAGMAVDITDRKQVELEKSEALAIRDEFFKMPNLLLTISANDGRFLELNAAWTETLGYSIEELRNRDPLDLVHPDDLEATLEMLRFIHRKNPLNEFINRFRTKSGTYRWLLWSTFPSGDLHYGFARDITQLKEAEAAIREQEARLRALSELAPQILWMANAKGEAYWFSKAMSDYTGVGTEELLKMDLLGIRPVEDQSKISKLYSDAINEGRELEVEERMRDRAGTYHWFLTRMRPEKDPTGKIVRWYGSHTDIDAIKKAQENSEAAKLQAERANAAKSQFLANMSHEIRTPLGAILGFAELMKEGAISTLEAKKYLDIVTRNGYQLSHIINDILDLSKVEAGQMSIELRRIEPLALVHEVVGLLHVKAEQKGVSFRFHSDDTSSNQLVTDAFRLRQILLNVIGNALKFTHSGYVQISLSTRRSGAFRYAVFEIADTGIGIPVSQQQGLFEVFAQGDGSTTRLYGGTGLGLSLSRKLARSLGGDLLLIRSDVGRGSVFEISIRDHQDERPLALPEDTGTAAAGATTAAGLPDVRGVRVLVAEDSPDNQELIRLFLERSGVQLEIVGNGVEAVNRALAGDFDLVLMDIQMPLMDGYTATRRLRDSGYRKPILAITAHAMREFVDKCLQAGCDDHIAKPLERAQLIRAIARYAVISRGHRQPLSELK